MGHVGKSRLITRSHMSCLCGNKQCVDIAMQRVTMIDGVHVDLSNASKEVLNKTMEYFGQQANKKSKVFINIDHYPLEQRHIVRHRGEYRCVDYVTDEIILPTQTIKDRQRELAKITYLHNKHDEILKQYSDAIVGKTEDLIINEKNLDQLMINSAGCENDDVTINNALTNHEGVVSSSNINPAHNTVESTHATGDNNNSRTVSNIYNNNDDDNNTNNRDEIRTPARYNVTRSPFLSPNNKKTKSSHNIKQLGISPRNIQNTILSDDANDNNNIMFNSTYEDEWELDNNNNDETSADANSNDIEIGKSTIPNIMNRLPKKNKLSLTSYPKDRYLHYYLNRQLEFTPQTPTALPPCNIQKLPMSIVSERKSDRPEEFLDPEKYPGKYITITCPTNPNIIQNSLILFNRGPPRSSRGKFSDGEVKVITKTPSLHHPLYCDGKQLTSLKGIWLLQDADTGCNIYYDHDGVLPYTKQIKNAKYYYLVSDHINNNEINAVVKTACQYSKDAHIIYPILLYLCRANAKHKCIQQKEKELEQKHNKELQSDVIVNAVDEFKLYITRLLGIMISCIRKSGIDVNQLDRLSWAYNNYANEDGDAFYDEQGVTVRQAHRAILLKGVPPEKRDKCILDNKILHSLRYMLNSQQRYACLRGL